MLEGKCTKNILKTTFFNDFGKNIWEKRLKNNDFQGATTGGARRRPVTEIQTTKIKLCEGGGRGPGERRETGEERRGEK